MQEELKQQMLDFLNTNKTCVVATVNASGNPEAATVGFSVDDDFKILIATNEATRKAHNLLRNSSVALVVGFRGDETVQIEATAEILDQETGRDRIELHFEKVPEAKQFAGEEGQTYYLLTPNWVKYTNYTNENPIVETNKY